MREHGSHAWLVNTGWSGGGYGVGNRMSLRITRKIIDSILDGSLEKADFESFKIFGFEVPKILRVILIFLILKILGLIKTTITQL